MTGPATAMLLAPHARSSLHELPSLCGRSLLDRALDRLADASVTRVLIGAGPDRTLLEPHVARRGDPGIILIEGAHGSDAVRRAIADGHLRKDEPFFLIDNDIAWFDGPDPALSRLCAGLGASGEFDAMLLLARAIENQSTAARAALALDSLGIVRRPDEREIAPFVFAGIQLMSASLFDQTGPTFDPTGPADLASLWDHLLASGRLGGLVHDGVWFHLPTESAIEAAEHVFDDRLAGIRL